MRSPELVPDAGRPPRLPVWCRPQPVPRAAADELRRGLRRHGLHSVCEEARCPNLLECFSRGTVTFMLLGAICTRACRFCDVATGRPGPVDLAEPGRVARAAAELGLAHVVLTSVNRDDLADGGSLQFVATLAALRNALPGATREVLTPDFRGDTAAIDRIADAGPHVYNHNLETVPRLYRRVRPGALYARSLALLERVASCYPRMIVKSGLMLGLGERGEEVLTVMSDLRRSGVHALTLGQYLRPSLRHLPVTRYLEPDEFEAYRESALGLGFRHVQSGPLVRSSFRADQVSGLIDSEVRP
ncbi:MAG: lipoyl synthase [Myxococcales bacterium]|nr:lipoyl synthase [Myxococcales bacterium]